MKKKKGILLTVIGLVGLIVITVGVTYAFFNYVKEGTTDNTITTSTITFLYTEIDKVGAGISINDAYPISDSQGKMLSGANEVFDFKITSTTPNTSSIPYEITARKNSNSTLDEDAVKLYLTKVVGTSEEEVLLSKYSGLTQTSKVTSDKYTEKTIYTGKVPADSSNFEQAFKLRMWIANDVDFSPLEDGSYPYNDKEFTITVNVYANAKVVTEEEVLDASKAEISSLSINGEELTPVTDQDYHYEISLPEGTTSTTLDIETTTEYATVKVERIDSLVLETTNIRRLSTKKTVDLNPGDNYFKVTVTSEDGKTVKEYKIKIKVKQGEVLLSKAIFNAYPDIQENATLDKTSAQANENGLFKSTATNSGDPTYYFRGNVENYVDFAGFTWRVVRINEDGTVRLILNDYIDRTNSTNDGRGYYKYNSWYYSDNSTVKTKLETWYNTNIVEKNLSSKVSTGDYYCEQAKTAINEVQTSYKLETMTIFSDYEPNFICETDANEFGKVNSSIGILNYDEVVHAGGKADPNGQNINKNYYLYFHIYFWTMSPAGSWSGTPNIWVVDDGSLVLTGYLTTAVLRPVINLKPTVTVIGSGKSDDHWVVQ